MPRLLPVLAAAALLHPGPVLAQDGPAEPISPAPSGVPATGGSGTPAPAQPAGGLPVPTSSRPTRAQQAVLDRIRRLRDGDQRRFGSCSYRWDRWKLLPNGSRTTSYSCEGTQGSDHTIGVNCSTLQINSYTPAVTPNGKGSWGSWRLPQPGGEEQMVAMLCANALPMPPAPPLPPGPPPSSADQAAPQGKGT